MEATFVDDLLCARPRVVPLQEYLISLHLYSNPCSKG